MLTEKPLTRRQQWDAHKNENRAERAAKKQAKVDAGRPVAGRAGRRAARRPSRKLSGRSTVHTDRGVFNINTGQHEPLPRPVTE